MILYFIWNTTWLCGAGERNQFGHNVTSEVVPPPGGGRFELQPQPGRVKWAAGRSKVKLTDTLIKTSDPFKPCGRLQPAISEEIQKETKYCSEAILKEIQYLHWKQNAT